MENILKKRLGVFVVLFVISFYFVGLYINENVKRIIKCPLITNSDGKVIYLPSYYGHTEDWFYFNWDKENQQFKNKRYKLIKGEYGFETTDQDTEKDDEKYSRDMFVGYDQKLFKYVKFRTNTSMGFVWTTYKTKSGSYWHQHPELKLYGCHRISKSELPK